MKTRRALSQVGGPTRTTGDAGAAALLADAMDRAAFEESDALTHGFHPWPARMHRAIAGVSIAHFSRPGDRVLDPFCGSGTVLLEATLAGRRAAGVDLNPIVPRLVRAKCEPRSLEGRERFLGTAIAVCERSFERVQNRERAHAKLPPSMLGLYGTHTLKEMAGLLEEIRAVDATEDREALELAFSSLVVKVSNKQAETSEAEMHKRIRKGLVTELFGRKCEELTSRWAELEAAMPEGAIAPKVFLGDARELPQLLGTASRANLVLASPPYGGTYDYHAQHAMRLAWLGLDARGLAKREVGSRRAARWEDEDEAQSRWDDEVLAFLRAMRGVLAPEGLVVLLMGDGQFGTSRSPILEQLGDLAPRAGLRPVAAASQPRPASGPGPMREEHLVLLAADGR